MSRAAARAGARGVAHDRRSSRPGTSRSRGGGVGPLPIDRARRAVASTPQIAISRAVAAAIDGPSTVVHTGVDSRARRRRSPARADRADGAAARSPRSTPTSASARSRHPGSPTTAGRSRSPASAAERDAARSDSRRTLGIDAIGAVPRVPHRPARRSWLAPACCSRRARSRGSGSRCSRRWPAGFRSSPRRPAATSRCSTGSTRARCSPPTTSSAAAPQPRARSRRTQAGRDGARDAARGRQQRGLLAAAGAGPMRNRGRRTAEARDDRSRRDVARALGRRVASQPAPRRADCCDAIPTLRVLFVEPPADPAARPAVAPPARRRRTASPRCPESRPAGCGRPGP